MKDKANARSKKNLLIFLIFLCIAVAGALAIYYRFMVRQQKKAATNTATTELERLIAKDLELGYPETPAEVMKLWGRLNLCIYNTEGVEDTEYESLLKQLRVLYSKDLLEQNEEGAHIAKLKEEVAEFQDEKKKMSNFTTDTGMSVKYKTIHDRDCAYARVSFFVNQKGKYVKTYVYFILVKEDDKWKILGFKEASEAAPSAK